MRIHVKLTDDTVCDFQGAGGSWVITGGVLTDDGKTALTGDAGTALPVVVPADLVGLADLIVGPFGYDVLEGEAVLVDGTYRFTSLDDGLPTDDTGALTDDDVFVANILDLLMESRKPPVAIEAIPAAVVRETPTWPAHLMPAMRG